MQVLALRLPRDDGKKPDMMVIAFRGTETSGQGSLPDILTDLLALRSHIGDMEGVPATKYPKSVEVCGPQQVCCLQCGSDIRGRQHMCVHCIDGVKRTCCCE